MPTPESILALDFGSRRIGVAVASLAARLPRPLTTLPTDSGYMETLQRIIEDNAVGALVVGLPRNLAGEDTAQTAIVRDFAHQLERLGMPVHFQDEALTSRKAEAELMHRRNYRKEEVDALAATYILEDFLNSSAGIKL